MKIINAGFKNNINCEDVIAISSPGSSPIKRVIKNAKEKDMLIDITEGNRTCSVIHMKSGHVILSINTPETLKKRINE
ncbi:DUF370 domain-containing protein [Clostridium gasigenes]|uniref:DUF370 domain-containing protein n=1 Tax=Clostridium gasigenes TaxID=94869 RepID=UPI0016237DAA|nr:extracellular matrix/biofilm biosynthesis regulator RemA family protein [Clostridium gasigenes]MBB6622248.1 DUF370 domain-containing protein [Clostridium gasigenes]